MSAAEPRPLASLADTADADGLVVVFGVLRSNEAKKRRNGEPFRSLTLADATTSIAGVAWDSAPCAAAASLATGTPVKVLAVVDSYQGAPQLNVKKIRAAAPDDDWDRAQLYGDVPEWLEERACKTLVFDIETVPAVDIRGLPQTVVKSLTTYAERREMDQSAVMGLSPFFGKVVSLAFGDGEIDPADQPVTAIVVPRDEDDASTLPDWVAPMDEPTLLRSFWTLASMADCVVTYNGRGFDVPFLVARSLIHGVPARVDLMSNRWSLRPHLDLYEAIGQRGSGPANLDTVCWALGIESPKGTMDGSMVAPAYERGGILEIAEYNREDIRATTSVYRQVRDHVLAFRSDWADAR